MIMKSADQAGIRCKYGFVQTRQMRRIWQIEAQGYEQCRALLRISWRGIIVSQSIVHSTEFHEVIMDFRHLEGKRLADGLNAANVAPAFPLQTSDGTLELSNELVRTARSGNNATGPMWCRTSTRIKHAINRCVERAQKIGTSGTEVNARRQTRRIRQGPTAASTSVVNRHTDCERAVRRRTGTKKWTEYGE